MPDPTSTALPGVLVVGPNAEIRRTLAAAVRRWRVPALFAAGGPEAVEICRENGSRIGVALIEVSLRDVDGLTAWRELRKIHPGLRRRFVGGTDGSYGRRQPISFGAEGLLPKPFDLKLLRAILESPDGPAARPMPGAERRTAARRANREKKTRAEN